MIKVLNLYVGEKWGFDLGKENIPNRMKRKLLNNLVMPKLGFYIFNSAFKYKQKTLTSEIETKEAVL